MAFPRKPMITSLFVTMMIMLSTSTFPSNARELRPADHGLAHQASPPSGQEMSPQMMSFFGTSASSTWSSWRSSTPPPAPAVALPTAMDSTATSWLRNGGDGGGSPADGGGKRDNVKQALIVGTMVCGIAGLCLLAVSAVIYVFRSRRAQTTTTTTLGNIVSCDANATPK